ncbi:dihydroorotase, homodimeric type [Exophiala aquamarina CBS 119918]|uniref:dihydroorotase n=1 Tax=Exophiala aquamarina CBS 119918 TaxID=1182545 RepID=A0A072PT15_9EURO|nr:dihydroorotase, homodimeric type [Exophiala aquamarina CBS 119918]KEF62877.1 dihydroorotase, homodimeric type [Exophiala aquamarina CBS 119918]
MTSTNASQGERIFDGLELPASGDFHVHLRDGEMMAAVAPLVVKGGVDTVFVMPNLIPPITTVGQAVVYQQEIAKYTGPQQIRTLMSLYLHPSITPETIREAKKSGVVFGVKSYPAGVTTNSASGVVNYEQFYPVFKAMEEEDLVLNLHGEAPPADDITVLNAEEAFLPTLFDLHARFPRLRIVLEHCTTTAAVEAVAKCGANVVATITPHHMFLIIDDVVGDPINFCKPVAKLPSDRIALLKAATSGNPKYFLGTDSAPHMLGAKMGGMDMHHVGKCAAGVFTQPYATQLVLEVFEAAVGKGVIKQEQLSKTVLEGFLGEFGRKFYRIEPSGMRLKVSARDEQVVSTLQVGMPGANSNGKVIIPFRQNSPIYSLDWLS